MPRCPDLPVFLLPEMQSTTSGGVRASSAKRKNEGPVRLICYGLHQYERKRLKACTLFFSKTMTLLFWKKCETQIYNKSMPHECSVQAGLRPSRPQGCVHLPQHYTDLFFPQYVTLNQHFVEPCIWLSLISDIPVIVVVIFLVLIVCN